MFYSIGDTGGRYAASVEWCPNAHAVERAKARFADRHCIALKDTSAKVLKVEQGVALSAARRAS